MIKLATEKFDKRTTFEKKNSHNKVKTLNERNDGVTESFYLNLLNEMFKHFFFLAQSIVEKLPAPPSSIYLWVNIFHAISL